MKGFERLVFDPDQCRRELDEFRVWLTSQTDLKERKHVLPFFRGHNQLSAVLGSYHPEIVRYDLLAYEFPLFGDFTCDLVVGDSRNRAYVFVEFEAALHDSIFVKKRGKATPEWSPRFEHGFSQLVDWFFKLHDQSHTTEFEEKFGTRSIKHLGLLVIGRIGSLGKREQERLIWRQEHVLLHSRPIYCKTCDHLYDDLLGRLEKYPSSFRAEGGAADASRPSASEEERAR